MDPIVFAAVLVAAACHAGWNATIKGGLDPLATTVLISVGAAVVAGAFLPIVGPLAPDAWPWCGASVLIHLLYFAALVKRVAQVVMALALQAVIGRKQSLTKRFQCLAVFFRFVSGRAGIEL